MGVASGLDALRLALVAAGIEPGDEVLVPANTFIATVEAVTQAGGRPVLVDVSEHDYNLDPAAVEAALTPRSRFLLPVHLYGQLADMGMLGALAERHGLKILEDACQAHGAERDGVRAGTGGLAAGFSFYPGKDLGAMGDAGALVTDDAELAARVRMLREHGQSRKYEHDVPGYTARLDTLQALVLLRKLPNALLARSCRYPCSPGSRRRRSTPSPQRFACTSRRHRLPSPRRRPPAPGDRTTGSSPASVSSCAPYTNGGSPARGRRHTV